MIVLINSINTKREREKIKKRKCSQRHHMHCDYEGAGNRKVY